MGLASQLTVVWEEPQMVLVSLPELVQELTQMEQASQLTEALVEPQTVR